MRQNVFATDSGRFVKTTMILVGNDTMIKNKKQISEPYAVAWDLMFYLAERHP
ncbi:MAG: hypothetical protein CMM07_22505 [Rhodopirellula sp.]|nr:hypothetical protein [Rhodopirellula sp.]